MACKDRKSAKTWSRKSVKAWSRKSNALEPCNVMKLTFATLFNSHCVYTVSGSKYSRLHGVHSGRCVTVLLSSSWLQSQVLNPVFGLYSLKHSGPRIYQGLLSPIWTYPYSKSFLGLVLFFYHTRYSGWLLGTSSKPFIRILESLPQ